MAAGSWTVPRAPGGARSEGECPVVCLSDALDDRQAEADASVVGADAFRAATSGPRTPRRGCPEHGARYGLCQIYNDEPCHYELRPEAVDIGCPPRYSDATRDPRTQQ